MSEMTVGEVREAVCRWASNVPAGENTHYVIVVHDQVSGRAAVLTCCADNRDSLSLLHNAIASLSAAN